MSSNQTDVWPNAAVAAAAEDTLLADFFLPGPLALGPIRRV